MRRYVRIATKTTVVLIVLSMVLAVFLPAGAIAGSYGDVTVSGTGTTTTGSTISVNAGSNQSNVGPAQSIGVVTGQTRTSSTCALAPVTGSGAGLTSPGSSSGGGSASAGTATGGTVIGGNAIGGNASGGDAVGASSTGGTGSSTGQAPNSSAAGGSAIGGSAVGGSAFGGTVSSCATTSAPTGGALSSASGDRTLVCGTIESYSATALTISTLTGQVVVDIPTGVRIIGTLPKDGNTCLVLTNAGGQIASILVLQCHGSTSGLVKLPASAPDTNVESLGGTGCGQVSLHSNTETSSSGTTPSNVTISIDCPDQCSPAAPVSTGQGASPLPTPTPTSQVSPGLPIVLPSGPPQTDVAAGVALQLTDLPTGFQQTGASSLDDAQVARSWHTTLAAIQSSGHVAAFESTFRRSANPGDLAIGDRIDVYRSGSAAHQWFSAATRRLLSFHGSQHARFVKQAGLGDEATESIVTAGSGGAQKSTVSLIFRRDRYIATISVKGLAALATQQRARSLAQVLDTRLRSTH